jgi:hypothetical protein
VRHVAIINRVRPVEERTQRAVKKGRARFFSEGINNRTLGKQARSVMERGNCA